MVPAQQRFETRYRAVFQPDDRLVQHRHLVAFERTAQIALHRQAVALARAHRRLEHLDAIAANALAVIHRKLGVLEHIFLALGRAVGKREPDRRGEKDLTIVEGDRRAQRLADRVGKRGDARRLALGEYQQAELVAGQARHRILRLQQPPEPAGER